MPRGAFGSGSVRTAPLVKKDERLLPGPAHYHQQGEGNPPPAKPRSSYTFASTSKRLYSPPSVAMVQYVSGTVSLSMLLLSSGGLAHVHVCTELVIVEQAWCLMVMHVHPLQAVPPPGSYEVCESFHHSQGKAELHRISGRASAAFLSSADRFAPPRDILLEQPDTFNPGTGLGGENS